MLQTDRGQFYAYKPKSQTMSSVLRPLKNNLVAVKKNKKNNKKNVRNLRKSQREGIPLPALTYKGLITY